jgi:hypothetical protein
LVAVASSNPEPAENNSDLASVCATTGRIAASKLTATSGGF